MAALTPHARTRAQDPSFNFLNSYAPAGRVGMELPNFVDMPTAIVNQAIDVINYLGQKISQNTIDWASIIAYSANLKDAANKYFASPAGQANDALTRIFKPSRIYEYGCFNSYWTGKRRQQRRRGGRGGGGGAAAAAAAAGVLAAGRSGSGGLRLQPRPPGSCKPTDAACHARATAQAANARGARPKCASSGARRATSATCGLRTR